MDSTDLQPTTFVHYANALFGSNIMMILDVISSLVWVRIDCFVALRKDLLSICKRHLSTHSHRDSPPAFIMPSTNGPPTPMLPSVEQTKHYTIKHFHFPRSNDLTASINLTMPRLHSRLHFQRHLSPVISLQSSVSSDQLEKDLRSQVRDESITSSFAGIFNY